MGVDEPRGDGARVEPHPSIRCFTSFDTYSGCLRCGGGMGTEADPSIRMLTTFGRYSGCLLSGRQYSMLSRPQAVLKHAGSAR
jgi:hypothetical protein